MVMTSHGGGYELIFTFQICYIRENQSKYINDSIIRVEGRDNLRPIFNSMNYGHIITNHNS